MSKKTIICLFVFLSLFLLWEICARSYPSLLFVLPSPSRIFTTLIECRERFFLHSYVTIKEMGVGFLIAFLFAFPLSWIMLRYITSRVILQPFFVVLQCLPMFALAPIMIIWFGWSFTAIVIPTSLMIFFPLTLNIYQGLRATPLDFLDFFKIHNATVFQTFFKLQLPWALPHIFAGLRVSSAISGIGAIAGEWAGAQEGLGILMLEGRRNVDLETTFASLFLLCLISMAFYGMVVFLEKIFLSNWPTSFLKKKIILLFFSALIIFPSCTKKPESTRLLLDWLPNPNHIPLYVGVHENYFEEEGIKLTIQKMPDSGGGISLLTSRQADLLVSHLPQTIKAASKGAKLNIIGTLIKEPLNCLIYNNELKVSTPADLSNTRLGYCVSGPNTAFLDYLLSKGKVTLKEKRNLGADLLPAFGTKKVDVIYGGFCNIEPFQLQSFGVNAAFIKLSAFDVPTYYEMIILANADSYETKSSFVNSFKKALQKSIDFCQKEPEKAFLIYQSFHLDKRAKTLAWEKQSWDATYPLLAKDQTIDEQMLKTFSQFLYDIGLLKNPIDYQKLIK